MSKRAADAPRPSHRRRIARWLTRAAAGLGVLAAGAAAVVLWAALAVRAQERAAADAADAEVQRLRDAGLLLAEERPGQLAFERSPGEERAGFAALLRDARGSDLPEEGEPLPGSAEPWAALDRWAAGPPEEAGPMPAAWTRGERLRDLGSSRLLMRLALRRAEQRLDAGDPAGAVAPVGRVVRLLEAVSASRGLPGLSVAASMEVTLHAWVEGHAGRLDAAAVTRLVETLERPGPEGVVQAAVRDRARWHAARMAEAPDARVLDFLENRGLRVEHERGVERRDPTPGGFFPEELPEDFVAATPEEAVGELGRVGWRNRSRRAQAAERCADERAAWDECLRLAGDPAALGLWSRGGGWAGRTPADEEVRFPIQGWLRSRVLRQASVLHARARLHALRSGSLPEAWGPWAGPDAPPADRFGRPWVLRSGDAGLLLYSFGPDGLDGGGASRAWGDPGGTEDVRARITK